MQKCSITISNQQVACADHNEFDSLIEDVLIETYGEDFSFDFDVWWRQCCIDFRVRNFSDNHKIWDPNSKETISVWQAYDSIEPFAQYFFNHEMFKKFRAALENQGWTVQGPVLE